LFVVDVMRSECIRFFSTEGVQFHQGTRPPLPRAGILLTFFLIISTLSAVSATAGETPRGLRAWFRHNFIRPEWESVPAMCQSPKDVCNLVYRHINPKREAVNHWYTPEETWKRRHGDCEDFAVCVSELCKQIGFESDVVLFYPARPHIEGHAIAVGTWDDKIWMSSMGSFKLYESMDEVKQAVARELGCGVNRMWSVQLDAADVEQLIAGNEQHIEPTAGTAQ